MKSLFKTTQETPKTNTWIVIITLLTGVSDIILNASKSLGLGERTIAIIGTSVAVVVFIINTLISNNRMKPLTTNSVGGFFKDIIDNVVGVFRGTKY